MEGGEGGERAKGTQGGNITSCDDELQLLEAWECGESFTELFKGSAVTDCCWTKLLEALHTMEKRWNAADGSGVRETGNGAEDHLRPTSAD